MELAPGLLAELRVVVSEADTAIAAGSGDVPVLATPRLLALAEAASVAAIEPQLGAEIVVEAELTEVAGRRLVFSFIVRHSPPGNGGDGGPDADEDLVVGAGTLERVVVDREKFLARLVSSA